MTHRITRLIASIVLLTSATLAALTTAPATPSAGATEPATTTSTSTATTIAGAATGPSAHPPETDLVPPAAERSSSVAATPAAVGTGSYSPVQWWPLRGSSAIGCAYKSPGAYCGSHHGYHAIDIDGPLGQPVYAAGGGIATVYDTNRGCSGYGVTVKVDHGPHGASIYAHLDDIAPAVKNAAGGLWVDENTVIGYVGHTGSVSGCALDHLHFEYWSSSEWSSTRTPTPDLKACVGDTLRTYPDFFGHDTWQFLPGHTYTAVSDGTSCTSGPKGVLEGSAGTLGGFAQLRGWTLDLDAPTTSTQVHVYVDGPSGSGPPAAVLLANRSRPDVAWSYPGAGNAHGFHAAVGGISPGTHQLFVYAVNTDGTPGSDTLLASPTITVPTPQTGMPRGSLDDVTTSGDRQVRVRGWALDPDVPSTTSQVQVFIDGPATSGAPSVVLDAIVSRPDVAAAVPGAGPLHGFDTVISDIEPGVRNLWVYALNKTGPSGNPLLGMRSVTVTGQPSACVAGSTAGPFTDVSPSHTFCRDIEWTDVQGIDRGYPNGTYLPSGINTRAMMADQLYNLAGKPTFAPPAVSPFRDVATSHPLYRQITWLATTGITTGYGDGTFRPDGAVARQAMAAFFYRMAGGSAAAGSTATAPGFRDVASLHPFYDEIAWLTASGITTGYGDGTFKPTGPVARQAMAAFVHRYDGL